MSGGDDVADGAPADWTVPLGREVLRDQLLAGAGIPLGVLHNLSLLLRVQNNAAPARFFWEENNKTKLIFLVAL